MLNPLIVNNLPKKDKKYLIITPKYLKNLNSKNKLETNILKYFSILELHLDLPAAKRNPENQESCPLRLGLKLQDKIDF